MATTMEAASAPVEEDEDAMLASMLGELKVKRKKDKKPKTPLPGEEAGSSGAGATGSSGGEKVMDKQLYAKLLSRVYDQLRANNPDLVVRKRALLRPPTVARIGTSRILWTNFSEICKMMRRDPEHVFRFFLTELGTTGSINSSQQFLMKGKFVPKVIESLLKKYINEYVTCSMCRGVDTKLSRDPMTRMYFMTCESCGATRAVATIQKGFVATARGERRAARNA